ncbi:MAG: modification methylase, partial [Ignavibacteria bacterium]|nr:modification methylase [Ignavibacteria bacterium]
MTKKSLNKNLHSAKNSKKDEFYTELTDIEKEISHYEKYFKNKVVFCNCDDPYVSNFFHFFSHNFEKYGLKKLITTCYRNLNPQIFTDNSSKSAVKLEYEGDKNGDKIPTPDEIGTTPLQGDGDFRSQECIALLKESDIVVTNPPFSLFREYVEQLIKYDKKFIILG